MLLMISQFIAYFNYSNLPSVLADRARRVAAVGRHRGAAAALGMIVIILLLDIIIPGVVPKWAIFAPIFVPLFIQLGVPPQTGLAAYRVGDSPLNVVTPLMVYLPFMVTIAQRYQKDAGIGTIIALMLPYVVIIAIVWILLFVLWFVLGLPLGPGLPGPGLTVGRRPAAAAMSDIAITFAVIAAIVVLFVWGRLPVEVVAIGAALVLWATGVLTLEQSLAGFGDPTVIFIATLFVVSEALDVDRRDRLGRPAAHRPGRHEPDPPARPDDADRRRR